MHTNLTYPTTFVRGPASSRQQKNVGGNQEREKAYFASTHADSTGTTQRNRDLFSQRLKFQIKLKAV